MAFLFLSVFLTWMVIASAEQLSYVVTSKPYYIQTNDNVNKLQRDFNHDNIGENEISETMENNMYADCELSNSCGNEDTRAGYFDATFKPFPQDELEKILKKYGKDKISDRISNSKVRPTTTSNEISSALSFQPVTNENTFDKSKSWSLATADTNIDSKDQDRVGWVTLEPVAWSSSQIQKWKPSIQSLSNTKDEEEEDHPWKNPAASKPQFDSVPWNPNKHPWHSVKPSSDNLKPDYEFEKPLSNNYNEHNEHKFQPNEHKYESMQSSYEPMKHAYDPLKPSFDSLKPIYDSVKPSYDRKPAYNPIKPTLDALGLSYDSNNPNYESIKTNLKPYWNQNHETKPSVNKIQSAWNSHVSSDNLPQIITSHNQDQFASYLQQHQQQKPDGIFEQNNPVSLQGAGAGPGDNDGHWVLLSSTREYSMPERQKNLSRSLKNYEFYRNSIPLTIYNPESTSKKFSRAIDHSDYKNYIPLTSSSNRTEFGRRAIPLIITAPGLNKLSHSTSNRHERKLESSPTEESGNTRNARRMVRLTVLPPVNGSNVVTSHNGMIEVENTKLTVDESHREHLARMMKLEHQSSSKKNEPQSSGSRMQRDTTSQPQPAHRMSMMLPIVIGRRRRRFEPSHLNYYPRNILTATH
uniref:Uncharacterized protein n=1 Tax=Cacopsylla melanoneura TaxID=428564 RepID=A0A8D8TGP8_9HEMI